MAQDAADRRAELQQRAVRMAVVADAVDQFGLEASTRVVELRAAADALRRDLPELARVLGREDRVIQFAQTVLLGVEDELRRYESRRVVESSEADAKPTAGEVFAAAMREWRNALDRAGRHGFQQTPAWTLSGSYVEVCNCEPMCSCRPVSDRRKRHPPGGVCAGALSWAIERGHADAVELDGLAAVLAFRHHQAERRGLWQFVVYLDERANDRQRAALVRLFAGAHGRRALVPLPWTPDSGRLVGLRTVCIQADHGPTNPRFDAGSHVCARVAAPVCTQISDSSLIVDHRRAGIERRSDRLRVADDALAFEFRNCRAFQGPFDYAKPDAP